MGRLESKVALVTGAGQGLGKTIALMFAREGAKVIVAEINTASGQATVNMINGNGGEAVLAPKVDLKLAGEVQAMAGFIRQSYDRLDIIVNNAGLYPGEHWEITELPEEVWDKFMDTNAKGVYLCCKYCIPIMKQSGGGSIINIASIAGLIAIERFAYAASKAAVLGLTRALARVYAKDNIRANAICPGIMETPALSLASEDGKLLPQGHWAVPMVEPLIKGNTVEDVAHLAVYLASDESSRTTCAEWIVDGGIAGR